MTSNFNTKPIYVTDHAFIPGKDGRCDHTWYTHGSGTERERCNFPESRHGKPLEERDPDPDPFTLAEATKRVLFHVVNTYQNWREQKGMMPNEFTDDAVRIGEQHLRDIDWFPAEGGWLDGDHAAPWDPTPLRHDAVLTLIDEELKRLREPIDANRVWWIRGRRREAWIEGVTLAREVSIEKLCEIRETYVVEALTRETETLRLYSIDLSKALHDD